MIEVTVTEASKIVFTHRYEPRDAGSAMVELLRDFPKGQLRAVRVAK